jgi:hypothetical protein
LIILQRGGVLTNKIFSLPIEFVVTDCNLESNVSFGHDKGLHADGPVSVNINADHVLGVESADDFLILIETRSCDIDDRSTQHVATLGRKHQRQICSSWNFLPRINLKSRYPNAHTYIFVASREHDFFVYSEYVSAGKVVGPAPASEIAQGGHLRVGQVFVALCAVASIESNLHKNKLYEVRY